MRRRLVVCVVVLGLAGIGLVAQDMPNPKQISGVPLPSTDTPAGSVSVRVIRGSFANNIVDQPVEFTIDGKARTVKTDGSGRAVVSGLKTGTRVRVVTVVAGERLESQEFALETSGIRVVLVAVDPDAAKREAEDRALAQGPAVKGLVALGPESRVVAEFTDEQLNLFYLIDIINTARTPVDPGEPVAFNLPVGARGVGLMAGTTKQASVSGTHVTVTGPFAPGTTKVEIGFEMAYSTGTARLEQKFPLPLPQVSFLMPQSGGLSVRSSQLANVRDAFDQGQPLIVGNGPSLAANQVLTIEISGLPHHPLWPRYTALALAGLVMSIGVWAAVFVTPRRQRGVTRP